MISILYGNKLRFSFPLVFFLIYIFIIQSASLNAQVNTERMRLGIDAEGFSGFLDINLRFQTGNVEVFDTGSGLRIQYLRQQHMTFLVTNIQYATKKSDPFINRGFTHIRYIYAKNPRMKWEFFAQHEFNEFTRLFNRTLAGTGGRFTIREEDRSALYYGTSYMAEREHIDILSGSGDKAISLAHRWSNYIVANWQTSRGAEIVNTLYVQPRFDDFHDFRILNEIELQTELTGSLFLTLNFHIRFDNEPPSGVKKTDTELRNSLRIRF